LRGIQPPQIKVKIERDIARGERERQILETDPERDGIVGQVNVALGEGNPSGWVFCVGVTQTVQRRRRGNLWDTEFDGGSSLSGCRCRV
jgi:hypothetical protein